MLSPRFVSTRRRRPAAEARRVPADGPRFHCRRRLRLLQVRHLLMAATFTDTFNENTPPTNGPAYISSLGSAIYEAMSRGNKNAVWVMQGWLFYSDAAFWKEAQMKGSTCVDFDRHHFELSNKCTTSLCSNWCLLHNFGGNIEMYGILDSIASGPIDSIENLLHRSMVHVWDFSGWINLILMNEWNRLHHDCCHADQENLLEVEVYAMSDSQTSKLVKATNLALSGLMDNATRVCEENNDQLLKAISDDNHKNNNLGFQLDQVGSQMDTKN